MAAKVESVALYKVPGSRNGRISPHAEGAGGRRQWLGHPTRDDLLLCVDDAEARVFSWGDLELIRVVKLSLSGSIQSLIPLTGALVATISESDGIASSAELWNLDSEPSLSYMAPSSGFDSSDINLLLGAFGRRLVVHTTDAWIASFDLDDPSRATLVRHFFMPDIWIDSLQNPIFGIGWSGEIVFVKGEELVVIKRGLEVSESGQRFHPGEGGSWARWALTMRQREMAARKK